MRWFLSHLCTCSCGEKGIEEITGVLLGDETSGVPKLGLRCSEQRVEKT